MTIDASQLFTRRRSTTMLRLHYFDWLWICWTTCSYSIAVNKISTDRATCNKPILVKLPQLTTNRCTQTNRDRRVVNYRHSSTGWRTRRMRGLLKRISLLTSARNISTTPVSFFLASFFLISTTPVSFFLAERGILSDRRLLNINTDADCATHKRLAQ